jgi:hypothetical protein
MHWQTFFRAPPEYSGKVRGKESLGASETERERERDDENI